MNIRDAGFPRSPHELRQEDYLDAPWRMLLVCMMLNMTSWKQVDQVRHTFFELWPDPESFLKSDDDVVKELIRPLGFYNKRCKQWKRFTYEWLYADWNSPKELHGVGKYAMDSWQIFQNANIDIPVEDKALVKYINWAQKWRSENQELVSI